MRFVDDIAEHCHVSFNATTTAMEILLGPAFFCSTSVSRGLQTLVPVFMAERRIIKDR